VVELKNETGDPARLCISATSGDEVPTASRACGIDDRFGLSYAVGINTVFSVFTSQGAVPDQQDGVEALSKGERGA